MSASEKRSGPNAFTGMLPWMLIGAAIVFVGRLTPFQPVQDFFNSFAWVTEQALKIAKNLFEDYGYLTIFLAPLLENTIFLGALIPGTVVMLLGGLSAHDQLIDLWPAIPLAIAGAWIGDTISYGIGRFGWQRLGPEARIVRWSEEFRESLVQHSTWIVLLYHFAGYSRTIGPAASGFLRIPFARWLVLDYIGSAIWVVTFVMLGYVLGVAGLSLDATEGNVRVVEIVLFILAAVGIVVLINRTKRSTRAKAASEGPMPAPLGQDTSPAERGEERAG
jgi:membrane protein DedA with SNARE-associated domain